MSLADDTFVPFETGLDVLTTPYLLTVTLLEPNSRLLEPRLNTWRYCLERWKLYVPDAVTESNQEPDQKNDVTLAMSQQRSPTQQALGRENALRITGGTGVVPDLSAQSAAYNGRVTAQLNKFGRQVHNRNASLTWDVIMNRFKDSVGQMPNQDSNQDTANMMLLILTEAEQSQLHQQQTSTLYTRINSIDLW